MDDYTDLATLPDEHRISDDALTLTELRERETHEHEEIDNVAENYQSF